MKLFLLLMASVSAGVASADHIHSFMLGLSIASLAVGAVISLHSVARAFHSLLYSY